MYWSVVYRPSLFMRLLSLTPRDRVAGGDGIFPEGPVVAKLATGQLSQMGYVGTRLGVDF